MAANLEAAPVSEVDPMQRRHSVSTVVPVESQSSTESSGGKQSGKFSASKQGSGSMPHECSGKLKGGEGLKRLVAKREKRQKILGMSVEYWDISIFSFKGRAWPMLPQVLYLLYSTLMVCLILVFVPNYSHVDELTALQFPISTLGTCLFLLLSFRTNSAYEHWWEGAKVWDAIGFRVEDMARMAVGWVAEVDKEAARGLVRWALVYAYVAKKLLRAELEYDELAGILSQDEIEEMEASIDPATCVAEKMTQCIAIAHKADLSPPLVDALEGNIKGLQAGLNACQRISTTALPFAYLVHLRSFMVLWLMGLPFAFVQTLKYWSILVCGVTGYQLLGMETIGVEIEMPFGYDVNDLPLDHITASLSIKMAAALAKLGTFVSIKPALDAAGASPEADPTDGDA